MPKPCACCQCRLIIPQKCRSKIPQFRGPIQGRASWFCCIFRGGRPRRLGAGGGEMALAGAGSHLAPGVTFKALDRIAYAIGDLAAAAALNRAGRVNSPWTRRVRRPPPDHTRAPLAHNSTSPATRFCCSKKAKSRFCTQDVRSPRWRLFQRRFRCRPQLSQVLRSGSFRYWIGLTIKRNTSTRPIHV